jgi:hypothetical protein
VGVNKFVDIGGQLRFRPTTEGSAVKKFFRWILALVWAPKPVPSTSRFSSNWKAQPRTFGMTRRQFFLSASATLAVAATTAIKLDKLMPLEDSWRYGWILEGSLRPVYYGIDMAYPLHLKIWVDAEEMTFDRLKEMDGYDLACAEINISQGHAGLKATGGFKALMGDEEHFGIVGRNSYKAVDDGLDDGLDDA